MTTSQPTKQRTLVKQVLSGDTVIVWGQPRNGPPAEKTITLANIAVPKLGRRATPKGGEETKDEPFAWEAREFLRKKLVGQEVLVKYDKSAERNNRVYGCILLGKDENTAENMTNLLVSEGFASVRRENARQATELTQLIELEDAAKAAKKGKWGANPQDHVRNPKKIDNLRQFCDKHERKPFQAIIEHVRDGSTVRVYLLPDFYSITLMISGIRCPTIKLDQDGNPNPADDVPYSKEARYFVESRLLQRDVEIVLESVSNNNFVGSIVHPKGNIAEILLKEGLAKCVDWSMALVHGGPEKLRAAERFAKEHKVRLWKDWSPSTNNSLTAVKEKEFTGTVTEIVSADALMVELPDGSSKKIFLASIRPPRLSEEKQPDDKQKRSRALYDIPWMFEAREFLRKNLIGKRVNVKVDYVMPASNNFPQKICCTVETNTGTNVAEAMVLKGFATVVKYRQDDDQRSSHYDELIAAEVKAQKSMRGIHAKKDIPTHRVQEVIGDVTKAKQFLPYLTRARKTEALVEFVASGSRLRLYVPKETCIITFLLAGINCPRGARPAPGGGPPVGGEAFGEEALNFTKRKVLQREVEIIVETMDKAGNYIGWLWIEGQNLSVSLVEAGFASVYVASDHSDYYRALTEAEESARKARLRRWKDYTEDKTEDDKAAEDDKVKERKENLIDVVVSEVTPELHFYVQRVEQGDTLTELTNKMRAEIDANPPLPGSYTPKKGEWCAAKFVDDQWYRAKVEKISGKEATVMYIDYGNRSIIPVANTAPLPSCFASEKPFAQEYVLAFVRLSNDEDYKNEAIAELRFLTGNGEVNVRLNEEFRVGGLPYAMLRNVDGEDIGRTMVAEGRVFASHRREVRFKELMEDYMAAEHEARRDHKNMWQYGDATEDDAKEFGHSR
ncbi:staphylococcal nuclease domain-containing protein 1 [Ischnura elegans]|uniref:staphylococcal nuclease domain-containing protein 1 n=1 Tax=Ischnura elegans TaxID=197161 RepID=UPI001ED8A7FA|nr:staphylococcal nuclease domain-containing protein 1 [Ischnura elegans]